MSLVLELEFIVVTSSDKPNNWEYIEAFQDVTKWQKNKMICPVRAYCFSSYCCCWIMTQSLIVSQQWISTSGLMLLSRFVCCYSLMGTPKLFTVDSKSCLVGIVLFLMHIWWLGIYADENTVMWQQKSDKTVCKCCVWFLLLLSFAPDPMLAGVLRL